MTTFKDKAKSSLNWSELVNTRTEVNWLVDNLLSPRLLQFHPTLCRLSDEFVLFEAQSN